MSALDQRLGTPVTSCSVAISAGEPIHRFRTVAEAMAFARSACGPVTPQVAVTAWTAHGCSTFAGCHVLWNSSSFRADTSVWSLFVDGQSAGTLPQTSPYAGDQRGPVAR